MSKRIVHFCRATRSYLQLIDEINNKTSLTFKANNASGLDRLYALCKQTHIQSVGCNNWSKKHTWAVLDCQKILSDCGVTEVSRKTPFTGIAHYFCGQLYNGATLPATTHLELVAQNIHLLSIQTIYTLDAIARAIVLQLSNFEVTYMYPAQNVTPLHQ